MQTQERSCVKTSLYHKHTYFNIIQPSIVQDGHGIPRTNKLFWSSIQGIKISLLLPPLYLLSVNHFYTYHICISTTFRWGKTPPRHAHQVKQIISPTFLLPRPIHTKPCNSAFGRLLTKNGHLSRRTDLERFMTSG